MLAALYAAKFYRLWPLSIMAAAVLRKRLDLFAITRAPGSKFFEPVARALDRDAMRRSLVRQSA